MMIRSSKMSTEYLNHQIQVLQQLQRLFTEKATLSDVKDLLTYVEAEYGVERSLEDVIQCLVCQHLTLQIEQRRVSSRRWHLAD